MCNFSKRSIAQTEAKKRSSRDIAGNVYFLDNMKFSVKKKMTIIFNILA